MRQDTVRDSMRSDLGLALLLLLSAMVESNSTSPPGKPALLSCRSPEKETFTCWWEPGADGGLPTTHRLYYERERLEGVHECPDYRSAGRNACFFDQNHTSIWVDYYLTVVASNALGNATSDPFRMDVMDIVRPNAPENLTLLVEEREDSPYLHIQWEPPRNTDTKSGWVTIKYELRVKQENDDRWTVEEKERLRRWRLSYHRTLGAALLRGHEAAVCLVEKLRARGKASVQEYMSGTQTYFRLYSVVPGTVCVVQVRCRLDHGSWSDWSDTTHTKVPNYLQREQPFWILVSALSAIPLIAAMCILVMKRKYVKQYVLPPVPVPKIRGVDFQALKSGQSEHVINALIINPNFHMMAWRDQMEEYLIVTEDDNGLLPDPSSPHKNKKSLMTSAGLHLGLEIQRKEPTLIQDECETAGERQNEVDHFVKKPPPGESLSDVELSCLSTQKQQHPGVNGANTEATEGSPSNHEDAVTHSGYVDTRTHVGNLKEAAVKQVDYSRVTNLNGDSTLTLEDEGLDSSGHTDVQAQDERRSDDYSRVKEVDNDCKVFLQKEHELRCGTCREKGNHYIDCAPQKPHGPGAFKVGVWRERDSGYVDNTSEPP